MQPLHIEGTELLDSLVTGIILLDPGYHVTYLNAAAQTLLALSPNQALGRRITDLSRGAETLQPLFERARQGGEGVVQRELSWPAPGGTDRILDCAVTETSLGSQVGCLLLEIEDITQHKRLTRENALLAQLGGSRLMVRQLAHEIKNPLGSSCCLRPARKSACAGRRSCWSASCSTRVCVNTRASSSRKRTG